MGYLGLAQGDYGEAAENFEQSIALDTIDQAYRVGLARAYLELGRTAEATQLLNHVVQVDPQRADAWGYLGIAYHQQNTLDLAISALIQSLHFNSNDLAFRLELAQALVKANRKEEAIEQYTIILAQDPSRTDIAQLIAELQE
jgi:predicted Zn-dependent protease